MFTLYGFKAGGSVAVEALLAEMKFPHRVEDVERNPDKTFPKWFLDLNPAAQIPVLRLPDDSIMTESAAMMLHLADLKPELGLAPAIGSPARAQYLRWMAFLATAIYETDLRMYYADRYSTDPAHAPGIKAKAVRDMDAKFAVLAGALGEGPFILGKSMSAVDIYAAMLLDWVADVPTLFARHANLKALHDAVVGRPAIAAAWKRNGM